MNEEFYYVFPFSFFIIFILFHLGILEEAYLVSLSCIQELGFTSIIIQVNEKLIYLPFNNVKERE